MAMHTPTHHLPTPHIDAHGRQILRDLAVALVLAIAVLLLFGAALMLRPGLPQFLVIPAEGQSLVEFRAAERASWAGGQTSEGESILLYREGERAGQ